MKVFLAATSIAPSYGGPAITVPRLGEALASLGASVMLWVANRGQESREAARNMAPAYPGIELSTMPLRDALARFGRADVVHDNGLWLLHNHALAAFAQRSGIPRIVSLRGMLEPWALGHKWLRKDIAWRLYQRRDLQRAAALHATSTLEAENAERLRLGPAIEVIPNGVDQVPREVVAQAWSRRRNRSEKQRRQLLFIGRLHPVKGLDLLIHAWARLRPTGSAMIIAGPDEGGHGQELHKLVTNYGLHDEVRFVGPVSGARKRELLLDSDLFAMPSHQESFGLAAAEALAHGLPTIATTGAPWKDLERVGAGWWVPPTVAGIEAALSDALARSRSDLCEMGEKAFAVIDGGYGWRQVASRVTALYKHAIARSGGARLASGSEAA